MCNLKAKQLELPDDQQLAVLEKQGRAVYGVDMAIVDDDGRSCPGTARPAATCWCKGPWVIESYFKRRGRRSAAVTGWFPTGDVATIDADGFMQITDRSKDVIKSGGEWISSIDLENIAMAHPAVHEAACIACRTPSGTSARCWWW